MDVSEVIAKARVLLEALPYIQDFRGSTFVVKYGGSFMDDPNPEARNRVATDIAFLAAVGINVVVVHGGGKAISKAMDASGLKANFINGLRVTDEATIAIVKKTLDSVVNKGGYIEVTMDIDKKIPIPSDVTAATVSASILTDLVTRRRTWRGEQSLVGQGPPRPMMLRADPVLSAPDFVLGFVLLFTDLTERRAVDEARKEFQQQILQRHRLPAVPLDGRDDLVFRNLLHSVVGNAQLAALEIADGVDLTEIPAKLEAVKGSVDRTTELLARLVWRASHEPLAQNRDRRAKPRGKSPSS